MGLSKEHILKILSLKGVGRRTTFSLCNLLKDDIIDTDEKLLEIINNYVINKEIKRLKEFTSNDFNKAIKKANQIIEESKKFDINYISYFDNDYPKSLLNLEDPPIILNYKGDIKLLNKIKGVAIIGTRKPTLEGFKSGEYFGELFAKHNFNIVSGLAIGCDSSAHKGCLNVNGITTAILANGLDTIYPKENKELADEIVSKGGLLLSEYFVGTIPLPNYFVERDRLQSGLAIATIVIQTAIKGGTMHAVNATIKSGKNLAAVEYKSDLDSDKILGNKMLINDKNAFALKSSNHSEFLDLISTLPIEKSGLTTNLKNDEINPESSQYKLGL